MSNGNAMVCVQQLEVTFKDIIEGTEFVATACLQQDKAGQCTLFVRPMHWLLPDKKRHQISQDDVKVVSAVYEAAWNNIWEAFGGSKWLPEMVMPSIAENNYHFKQEIQNRLAAWARNHMGTNPCSETSSETDRHIQERIDRPTDGP